MPSHLDVPCLKDGEYLNDSVIDFFFGLLTARAARDDNTELAILGSYTLTKIQMIIKERLPNIAKLKLKEKLNGAALRQTLKLKEEQHREGLLKNFAYRWFVHPRANIQKIEPSVNRVILPYNISNNHWALAVVFLSARKVLYYCSSRGPISKEFQQYITVLFDTLSKFRGYGQFGGGWTFERVAGQLPKQKDGVSCGVFLCAFADCIADGREPSGFGQREILSLRAALRVLVESIAR